MATIGSPSQQQIAIPCGITISSIYPEEHVQLELGFFIARSLEPTVLKGPFHHHPGDNTSNIGFHKLNTSKDDALLVEEAEEATPVAT